MPGDLEFDLVGNDRSKPAFDSLLSGSQAGEQAIQRVNSALSRMDQELDDSDRRARTLANTMSKLNTVGPSYGGALDALGIPSGGSYSFDPSNRRFRTGGGLFADVDTVPGSNPGKDSISGWIGQLQSSLEDPDLTDRQRRMATRDLERLKGALQRMDSNISQYAKETSDQADNAGKETDSNGKGGGGGLSGYARRRVVRDVAGMALGGIPGGNVVADMLGSAAGSSITTALTGAGAAAIAVSEAVRFVNDALTETDRRRQQIDLLTTTFGDVEGAIKRTQEAIRGVASKEEIATIFLKIDKNSVLSDAGLTSQLSAVTQELSYRFGKSWQETTAQIIADISNGNGASLENSRVIKSADEAMLSYAESIGKTVPQLTAFERQQALVNAVLSENQKLLSEPDSGTEQRIEANANLSASWHDLRAAFQEWVVSLIDPSATGALDFWAQKLNGLASDIRSVEQSLSDATDERRLRSRLTPEQLGGYDALSAQAEDARKQYVGAVYEKQVASGDFSEEGKKRIVAESAEIQKLQADYESLKETKDRVRESGLQGNNILNDPAVQAAQAYERMREARQQMDQIRYEMQSAQTQSSAAQTNLGGYADDPNSVGAQQLQGLLAQKKNELAGMQAEYQKAVNEYFASRPTNEAAPSYAGTTATANMAAKLDVDIQNLGAQIAKGRAQLPELERYQAELDRLIKERAGVQSNLDSAAYADNEAARAQNINVLRQTLEAEVNALQEQRNKLDQAAVEASDKSQTIEATRRSYEEYRKVLETEIQKTNDAANQALDAGNQQGYEQNIATVNELYRQMSSINANLAAMPANTAQMDYEDIITQLGEVDSKLTSTKAELAALPNAPSTNSVEIIDEAFTQLDDLDRKIAETKQKLADLTAAGAVPQGQIDALLGQLGSLQQQRDQATPQSWLPIQPQAQPAWSDNPFLNWSTDNAKTEKSVDQINAMFGTSAEAISAANEALNSFNVATPVEMMSKLAEAEKGVAEAETALASARASGNQGLEEQAQRNLRLAEANRQYVQAVEEVAIATGKLSEAKRSGTVDDVAAAENQLKLAQAYMTGTESLVQSAKASVDAGAALRLYREAQAGHAAAIQSGNVALQQQTQIQLDLAASLLNSATASNVYNSVGSQTVQVAGILLDKTSGLPVAFDAMSFAMSNGAVNANALNAAMASLDLQLQQIEASAANAAFSIAQRLVPAMGVGGSLQWATERANEVRDLRTQFDAINQQQVSSGKNPFGEQVFQMFAGELQSGWNDQANQVVSQLNKVGSAGTKTADVMEQVGKRINSALDSMIGGVLQDSTKGLIKLDDLLPREDTVDENARRMADVAVKGFQSPWYEGLKNMFPEEVLQGGEEAVKKHAARMVRDHQEGLTAVFYDTNRAADMVIEKLRGAQEQQAKIAEIREAVKAQGMNASDLDIASALGIDVEEMKRQAAVASSAAVSKNMGNAHLSFEQLQKELENLANGDYNPVVESTKVSEDGTEKIKTNAKAATKTMGEAMVQQVADGAYGSRAVLAMINQFNEKKESVQSAGKSIGSWWATSALDEIVDKFPPGVLDILVKKLGPLMIAAENGNVAGNNTAGTQ